MAMEPLDQNTLIKKINLYQANHNRPLFLSSAGFCNALTTLYLVLGKEELFKLIKPINNCPDAAIMLQGKAIEKFLNALEGLQNFHHYLPELQQSNIAKAIELMRDKTQQSIEEVYKLSFVFDEKQLATSLKSLLQENLLTTIEGLEHVIGVVNSNGEYHLYDANESLVWDNELNTTVWKSKSAEGLVEQLHEVFLERLLNEETSGLPLSITVFKNPNQLNNNLPRKNFLLINLCSTLKTLNDRIGPNGFNALHLAALKNDNEAIEFYSKTSTLNHEIINLADYKGRPPLLLALSKGDLKTVKQLLDLKARLDISDKNGYHALHYVVQAENIVNSGLLIFMLGQAKHLLNTPALTGKTPLAMAIEAKASNAIPILLHEGADPNIADNDGVSPLMTAIMQGDIASAKALIVSGAKLDASDNQGKTTLHYAAEGSDWESFQFLVNQDKKLLLAKDNQGRTSLTQLLAKGNYTKIRELVGFAIENKHGELVKELLSLGVNPNVGGQSQSLLEQANQRFPEVLPLLIQYGAYIEPLSTFEGIVPNLPSYQTTLKAIEEKKLTHNYLVRDEHGKTALHYFVERGNADAVNYLLDKGYNPQVIDDVGYTPLYYAAMQGHLNIAQALLEKGSEANFVEESSKTTALYLAAKAGHIDIVKLLLESGANPDFVTNEGKTALFAAIENKHDTIATLLLHWGANSNLYGQNKEKDDCLPLFQACMDDNLDLIKLLLEKGADPTLTIKYSGGWMDTLAIVFDETIEEFLKPKNVNQFLSNSALAKLNTEAVAGNNFYFRYMLQDKSLLKSRLLDGNTLLHIAVRNAKGADLVQYLFDQGLDVNAKDFYGNTPLHQAVLEGQTKIVEVLLKHPNINVNVENNAGISPLERAKMENHQEILALLKEKQNSLVQAPTFNFNFVK